MSNGQRRRKGTGTLFKRGEVWYARWKYAGKEKTVSTGETSRVRAEEMLLEMTQPLRLRTKEARLNEVERQIAGVHSSLRVAIEEVVEKPTLGKLEDMFRKSPRRVDCSEAQLERFYVVAIRKVVEFFGGGMPIVELDDLKAERFAEASGSDISPNTYNKRITALREVWRAVEASAGLKGNPWSSIPKRRLDTVVRRPLSDEEVEAVLGRAEGDLKVLVALGVYTGLRLGDAVQLKWSSVDIEANTIDVKTSKTGSLVSVPIHPRLMKVLPKRSGEEMLPRLAKIYRSQKTALSKMVMDLFESVGIKTSEKYGSRHRPVCSFHSLRHTFVTRAMAAGVPVNVVQQIVGHASMTMTEHYDHVTNEEILSKLKTVR